MAKRIDKSLKGEAPLEQDDIRIEIDPETGGEIRIERHQRGVMVTETKTYDGRSCRVAMHDEQISARQRLQNFSETLRTGLRKRGHPTDESRFWIEDEHGKWRPCQAEERQNQNALLWYFALQRSASALSKARKAGDLLNSLVDFLNNEKLDDRDFYKLSQLLHHFGDFRVAGAINYWAHQGLMSRKGRGQGPKTRTQRAQARRKIAMRHAEAFWLRRAILRNDASNTSKAIVDTVNEEIRVLGLLPKNKFSLSATTIAGWIGTEIGG